jgi:Sulfotransferase family
MDDPRPDFIVIGAMKSATTTLHEQLARQPGLFLSHPKEPNFFSDDAIYARGWDWYASLFAGAPPGSLRGESSTHYTKLPTYPHALDRIADALSRVKLIYVMRHPIERLVSQYRHQRNVGSTTVGVDEAIDRNPELIDYSLYTRQLSPYIAEYGRDAILPLSFHRLTEHPQAVLDQIGHFLGVRRPLQWDFSLKPRNVTSERLRPSALRQKLVALPILTPLRQALVPRSLTEPVKGLLRANVEVPDLAPETTERLREIFDADLAQLGDWLGMTLTCDNFRDATRDRPMGFA